MLEYLRQLLISNADQIPFLAASIEEASKVQISTQRILEAAVIGAVLAGIGYIAVIPQLDQRMTLEFSRLRDDISELKHRVEQIEVKRESDYKELSNRRNYR